MVFPSMRRHAGGGLNPCTKFSRNRLITIMGNVFIVCRKNSSDQEAEIRDGEGGPGQTMPEILWKVAQDHSAYLHSTAHFPAPSTRSHRGLDRLRSVTLIS